MGSVKEVGADGIFEPGGSSSSFSCFSYILEHEKIVYHYFFSGVQVANIAYLILNIREGFLLCFNLLLFLNITLNKKYVDCIHSIV
jgi:hypothetical protein